jgi:hypothetical protein
MEEELIRMKDIPTDTMDMMMVERTIIESATAGSLRTFGALFPISRHSRRREEWIG